MIRELANVPNIVSLLRLALIPVFLLGLSGNRNARVVAHCPSCRQDVQVVL